MRLFLVAVNEMTPTAYARLLLGSLGRLGLQVRTDERSAASLWRDSGGMWLTSLNPAKPRTCSAPVASAMQGAWLALDALMGNSLNSEFDAYRLLGERAAISGFTPGGEQSSGRAAHLCKTLDGWLVVNLARDCDYDLMPAWLEEPVHDLAQIKAVVASRFSEGLVARGREMGLAISHHEDRSLIREASSWVYGRRYARRHALPRNAPLVLDLSSLWAGPLCGQMLRECGARVIKIESEDRPDGARRGSPEFYQILNADKESVALDLRAAEGRGYLDKLLARADIIIEASRPRALEQMGFQASGYVRRGQGKVWLSITGYGRSPLSRNWIGFGDDVATAAGLSTAVGEPPVFCADAVADPLTGIHAAVAAMESWMRGGGELLDVSLFSVAAHVAKLSDPNMAQWAGRPMRPRARALPSNTTQFGADTERVLKEFLPPSDSARINSL